ncbi:MAG: pgeF [Proteobacteria bacterium]|nr:pgeF [Pseudomonadota bacterium]
MTTMTPSNKDFIVPDWPAPPNVRALQTTRQGGVSLPPYASFNLGNHVGDDRLAVAANRARLSEYLAGDPVWLEQVHGTRVVDAASCSPGDPPAQADASFSRAPGAICAVMTADCLPVLFCADDGSVVAAAHAGWRGLLAGVLEETIAAMAVSPGRLLAYLGPAIGPRAFEVGDEVRSAFVAADGATAAAFKPALPGKWLADLYLLARLRLAMQGVARVYGGAFCTASDADRFFSYRRDGQTGRMASLIWLASS